MTDNEMTRSVRAWRSLCSPDFDILTLTDPDTGSVTYRVIQWPANGMPPSVLLPVPWLNPHSLAAPGDDRPGVEFFGYVSD